MNTTGTESMSNEPTGSGQPLEAGHSVEAGHPVGAASRRRSLRWLVPVGAAGMVALVASGVLSADAKPNLPPQTAAQLLASIGHARLTPFSGTVVEKASLGLPELPNIGGVSVSSGMLGLLSGSHTTRVWYGGETKQRVALLDSLGEQDLFRNGREVWQWASDTRTATHTVLPADAGNAGPPPTQDSTVTPEQAAQQALAMIDPSTIVTTDRSEIVAGRAAYALVLQPKDARSRVTSVRIAVDGKTKIPLSVQVYGRGGGHAALDVSFTRFDASVPDDDNFNFAPPAGAIVKQSADSPSAPGTGSLKDPVTGPSGLIPIGTGWTTVVKVTGVPSLAEIGQQSKQTGALLGSLPEVTGNWGPGGTVGTGSLFTSALVTGLFTSDGRAFIGTVDPEILYHAAGQK